MEKYNKILSRFLIPSTVGPLIRKCVSYKTKEKYHSYKAGEERVTLTKQERKESLLQSGKARVTRKKRESKSHSYKTREKESLIQSRRELKSHSYKTGEKEYLVTRSKPTASGLLSTKVKSWQNYQNMFAKFPDVETRHSGEITEQQ